MIEVALILKILVNVQSTVRNLRTLVEKHWVYLVRQRDVKIAHSFVKNVKRLLRGMAGRLHKNLLINYKKF